MRVKGHFWGKSYHFLGKCYHFWGSITTLCPIHQTNLGRGPIPPPLGNARILRGFGTATRVGHVYAEYAVHADYAHYPHYPHINIYQKWQFFGPKMDQPGSVFNSECPKYPYCSSHLVLTILRN